MKVTGQPPNEVPRSIHVCPDGVLGKTGRAGGLLEFVQFAVELRKSPCVLHVPIIGPSASIRRGAAARRARAFRALEPGFYPERMLDLGDVDVEEIAAALADQTDYEHRGCSTRARGRWRSGPATRASTGRTRRCRRAGSHPIASLPSYVWFQDMADFAERIRDREAGRDLTQSLMGRGAFRRFKNQVYDHHPELVSSWHALRDVRAQRRAVEWLLDQELIDASAAEGFVTRHPDPDLP